MVRNQTSILFTLILFLIAGCTAIPRINQPPQVTTDRSWVPSNAVIYGADPAHGFFRYPLSETKPQTLAKDVVSPQQLEISPDKSQVFIDAIGRGMNERHLIYDTNTHILHDLGSLIEPASLLPGISPDWHYIAWWNDRSPGVHIVNLHDDTVRTFHLPMSVEKGGMDIVGTWAADGSVLVTRRPWTDRNSSWSYWKMDPVTGTAVQIEAKTQNGVTIYLQNGQTAGVACPLCSSTTPVNQLTTPSGALAYISDDHDLIVRDPNGSLNVVAKHIPAPQPPPGGAVCMCGPEGESPRLWTLFDGDVLLYSFGNFDSGEELFVYGIAEHKISPLGVAPFNFVF